MKEEKYFYAIRIQNGNRPPYLARQNASAPALFWFHEDAIRAFNLLTKSDPSCDCPKCTPQTIDIVKVLIICDMDGKTYNTSGDMFRSGEELAHK